MTRESKLSFLELVNEITELNRKFLTMLIDYDFDTLLLEVSCNIKDITSETGCSLDF